LRTILLSTLLLTLAAPAVADPTVGFGVTYSFGGGQPQAGIGLRVFSNDEQDEFAGTVGVDYMLGTRSWRGTIGAAYLAENVFAGVDLGYDFGDGTFGFGVSAGAVKTAEPASAYVPDVADAGDEDDAIDAGF
jgi:hypothetical protein